jgi:hypothetical protein
MVSMGKFGGLPFWISGPIQLISLSVRVIVYSAVTFFPNTSTKYWWRASAGRPSSWRKRIASCCDLSPEDQLNFLLGAGPRKWSFFRPLLAIFKVYNRPILTFVHQILLTNRISCSLTGRLYANLWLNALNCWWWWKFFWCVHPFCLGWFGNGIRFR